VGQYVDIHSHVLPAVDDGSPSMEISLEMLLRALAEGIDTLVLTPHMKAGDDAEVEEAHRVHFAC
jgi:protein-tyrosine phosphatase